MTLAAPQFLWALLLVPLLWWLSQPPRPSRYVFSAHLRQWQAALAALRRRPPRGSRWRLLLLSLATIAAAFAAARPVLPGAAGPDRLVVLLDASASMAARDGDGQSAFAQALGRLRTAFAVLPEQVDVTVLRCGGDLRRRLGRSARALQDLGEPGGELAVDLPRLAAAAAREPGTAVWTLTDGQGQPRLPVDGALSCFDAAGPNAAITDVRLQDAWPLPLLAVEVDVIACAGPGAEPSVSLLLDGAIEPQPPRVLTLQSGTTQTLALQLTRLKAGGPLAFQVTLAGDRLALDDRFVVQLPPLPAPRIAVLAEADAGPFAEVAADALAGEVGGQVVAADSGDEVGLLLIDGGRASIVPGETRAVTFGCRLDEAEPEAWFAQGGIDWSRQSPLMAGLDLSELRVDRAWRSILPAGEVLLQADDGSGGVPLLVLVAGRDVASVHFAFRLQDSNLPLLAAFPQLLRRAFVRSYGDQALAKNATVRPAGAELDLLQRAAAPDRALPGFAGQDRELARWFVVAGLLALAVRAFVR